MARGTTEKAGSINTGTRFVCMGSVPEEFVTTTGALGYPSNELQLLGRREELLFGC